MPQLSFRKPEGPSAFRDTSNAARTRADEATMRLVQNGDREALGELFDRYARLVLSVATRILHNPTEAQDVVQDVFLYIHRKSHVFDASKGTFSSWLVQITYSRAFTRREHLSSAAKTDCLRIEELVDLADAELGLDRLTDALSARAVIEQALTELTERQRETLRQYFFDGYSLAEISSNHRETFTNTRHHYYRGIEKLKEILHRSRRKPNERGA